MRTQTLRVLVVDDELPIASAIGHALERRGHAVCVVESAEEALQRPAHQVLVSDVRLGGLDGFQLIDRLRLRGEQPRTVLFSGEPTFESCQRALRMGASDFIRKPFRLTDVIEAVERAGLSEDAGARSPANRPEAWRREYTTSTDLPERAARDLIAYALRCGIGPSARSRIGTAVADIVENAVIHGYADLEGPVELSARIDARSLHVTVRDHGLGFDALSTFLLQSPGASEGGMGRAAALVEQFAVDSSPDEGTEVRLEFCVTRTSFGDQNKIDLSDLDFLAPETARAILAAMQNSEGDHSLHISPAMAVTIGRLLSGPDLRQGLQNALRS
jgi:FixJ family two-component response regulator